MTGTIDNAALEAIHYELASMRSDLEGAHRAELQRLDRLALLLDGIAEGRELPEEKDPGQPRFDDETRELVYDGRAVRVEGIPRKILEALLAEGGRYLSKNTLMRVVWGERIEASALHQTVRRLRRLLEVGGLPELATAIESTRSGHYRLRPIWRPDVSEISAKCRTECQ